MFLCFASQNRRTMDFNIDGYQDEANEDAAWFMGP